MHMFFRFSTFLVSSVSFQPIKVYCRLSCGRALCPQRAVDAQTEILALLFLA
uniref:Uncharacterized protein n=1 Tax=Anguilla anguilla TaxID=7936 RepID=A0A0E9XIQ8_ANGAN